MKPQGRKFFKCPTKAKTDYHIHDDGHKVKNWWEEVVEPNKRRERQENKQQIKKIVSELSLF